MIVARSPNAHLTYCTNVHRGETWGEILGNIRTYVLPVKERVCPDHPFGLGLRLSAVAAHALCAPDTLSSFREFLRDHDLYLLTINGFPYGDFSGTSVKEHVYRPDWLEGERVAYTCELAGIMAALAPEDVDGSISTVPGCFRPRGTLPAIGPAIAERIREQAAALWRLRDTTGRTVTLALEPEPHCAMETTADAADFFEKYLLSTASIRELASKTGLTPSKAEAALRRHVGVCLDACHAAVEFESPEEAIGRLTGPGIGIFKVQVSAGLRVLKPDAAALAALKPFAEDVYLHQVVVRIGDRLERFVDLPQALAAAGSRANLGDEWRVHFHVPLFLERLEPFLNTQVFLAPLLALLSRTDVCRQLEVETYSWDVLPVEYRRQPVVEAIARELTWTLDRLRAGAS
jgi:hypothetical protein